MEKIVERVIRTYGMMVNLRAEEEPSIRQRVVEFISGRTGDDDALAVAAIRHLRGGKPSRTRRAR